MENDRGTRPATPASPATSANESERPIQISVSPSISGAAAHAGPDGAGFEPVEADAGAEAEIESMFKAKLMDLRRLPRCERSLAFRAAREWHQSALNALRAKRARDRQAQYMLWRLGRQAPRAPG
jgi:hypothetical protein